MNRLLVPVLVALLTGRAVAAPSPVPGTPGPIRTLPPITVVVDGIPLRLDVPPIQLGGRVLVPVRGVFERLGASLVFDPLTQTVTASRADTTVTLRLGSREGRVNDRVVQLDVPAIAIGGRTMVPLRFISEVFGASVEWDGATRTVRITTTPVPSPTVTVGTRTIEGTVLRVDVTQGQVQVLQGTLLYLLAITPDTAILRKETTTGSGGSVSLREVRPGDHVVAVVNERLEASVVRATFRQVRGTVETVTLRTILLREGGSYQLHLDVVVSGRVRSREDVRPGMTVTLRLNPITGIVWEITVD